MDAVHKCDWETVAKAVRVLVPRAVARPESSASKLLFRLGLEVMYHVPPTLAARVIEMAFFQPLIKLAADKAGEYVVELAVWHVRRAELQQAVELLTSWTSRFADNARLHGYLGLVCAQRCEQTARPGGQQLDAELVRQLLGTAKRSLQRALELQPPPQCMQFALAYVKLVLADGELDEALGVLQRFRSNNPANPNALRQLGLLLLDYFPERHDAIAARFVEAHLIDPACLLTFNVLADYFHSVRDAGQLAALAGRVLVHHPADAAVWRTLAAALQLQSPQLASTLASLQPLDARHAALGNEQRPHAEPAVQGAPESAQLLVIVSQSHHGTKRTAPDAAALVLTLFV
eukprot:TRINITY_DN19349_c0_g1_i1.p1 TRINITY_DN19349_c0_g1~~TRINITY_DN19349_c0_g1_i1.p1  ORF type:complete len:368 (-),score=138.03 TRINITY_DN19349_c0_g1_i1:577-1617(-)